MLINEESLQHWLHHFHGYGSWEAPIWFVSNEESGGEMPEEVADRIEYFRKHHDAGRESSLVDIREMYRHVRYKPEGSKPNQFKTLYDYRFGPEASLHGLWKNLIAFSHGYLGNKPPDLLADQTNLFLSPSTKREALIRLYPLPAQNDHAWYYSWLDLPSLPWLKSRAAYHEHLFPVRIEYILQKINQHQPRVVLMYGMENINRLKNVVSKAHPAIRFLQSKAIPQKLPQYHRAELGNTTLLITTQIPALHHRRVETGFDWEGLGKSIVTLNSDEWKKVRGWRYEVRIYPIYD